MNKKLRMPAASAAIAIMLLSSCGDDDDSSTTTSESSTTTTVASSAATLAEGAVTFDGTSGLGGQSLDIVVREENGQVTGDAHFTPSGLAVSFECGNTEGDGMFMFGGKVTATTSDNNPPVGARMAVIVLEAEPDSVVLWFDEGASGSCKDVLDTVPDDIVNDPNVTFVVAGDDIETGWDCEDLCAGT